jgi:hypothetical protein
LPEIPSAESACIGFWAFAEKIYDKGGLAAMACILMGYIFYQLIWKVWQAAMRSKDDELERLIEERNFLQAVAFPNRESSYKKSDAESQ